MTGLFLVASMSALALAGLWWSGVRGALLQLSAAVLLFASAGYAIQGRPGLAGSPRDTALRQPPIPLTNLRHAFFGRFTATEHWLVIAESYARRGRTQDAAGVLGSAVREHPRDIALWIGLGNALADHSGALTPAARLAYRRAIEIAPDHPAPQFFYGLARARSGEAEAAVRAWNALLANAPAEASWRPEVEDAIRALSRGAESRP